MNLTIGNITTLFKGFRVIFDDALQAAPTDYEPLCLRVPSGKAEEVYAWLGALPGMKKVVGPLVLESVGAVDWTIKNEEWADAVEVPRTAIERDSYGIYNPLISSMGEVAKQHPDTLLGALLDGAFTTTKDYTGSFLCSANKVHEPNNPKSTKFTNKGTGVLNEANLKLGVANIKGRKNSKNRAMKLGRGGKLTLIVPVELEYTARALVENEHNAAGASNPLKGVATVLVFPDLTSPSAWFLVDASRPIKPFIYQEEVVPHLSSLVDPDNPHTFMTGNFVYKAYARYNMAAGMPQFIFGSDGSTA